jgi:hypothetical protein
MAATMMIYPFNLSPGTREKLFAFVDALEAELPWVDERIRAGLLEVGPNGVRFVLRSHDLQSLARWFWLKVKRDPKTQCWEWMGRRDKNGYGILKVGGERILAHRAALILILGDDTELLGCHRCNNPPCVSPFHVYRGTHRDNAADLDASGGRVTLSGRDNSNTRYISFNGQTLTLTEWRLRLGLSQVALHRRLRLWPIDRALSQPKRKNHE